MKIFIALIIGLILIIGLTSCSASLTAEKIKAKTEIQNPINGSL